MGEISSVVAMRPVTFFILLTIAVLLLPSIVIPIWYNMMKKIEHNVNIEANSAHHHLITKVEDVAELILPTNYSVAINLAKVLDRVSRSDKLLFSDIQIKVAPALFGAQTIVPHVTQASYIGLDGLFFAYYKDGDQLFAIYSNTTFAKSLHHYTWYTQLVNPNSGELYGEANITKPRNGLINATWFQQAMNSPSGSALLGLSWNTNGKVESNLMLDTARLGSIGAISLGFSVQAITDFYTRTDLNGASLFIATLGDDSKVLMRGLNEANIKINGSKALVYNNNQGYVGEVSCEPKNRTNVTNVGGTTLDIGETSFIFYCSEIDLAMVPMVYVLAFPNKGLVNMVHKHTNIALILLCVMLVAMVISVFAFVAMLVIAARREVHLCVAYMREMEKTSQAERKSMKQSLAFASANHDVRGYLACIKGLIELSTVDLPPSSELASNLRKMDACAEDLLALVNSILDFSKIEAGKMQLEDKEFNLAQLLEDLADLYHPVAMKKRVEVILDPCDGSLFKFSHVKGDRGKLKQILSNLLSNAVKFTSEGSICIRCHAKKPSLENSIIASNRNNLLNRVSSFFHKNKRAYNDLEKMKRIQQDPSCLEFEFEVEDTGVGIPKDKRRSIFEDFVQVKETSSGQAGTGLGLGIVQSLVRLMGGDIEIVDKRNGEQGTCFKFNIFLLVQEEGTPIDSPNQEITEHKEVSNPSTGLSTCVRSPRGEKSLVIVLIKNGARRAMVHRYMDSLGINLKVLSHVKQLYSLLKKIKSKLVEPPPSYNNSSSGRSDSSLHAIYWSSSSDCCRPVPKLLPLNMMEGSDDILPVYKRSKARSSTKCILLIVDCNATEDFKKLQRAVTEFRKDLYMTCTKVVWLDRPETRKAHFKGLHNESLPCTDDIMLDPLHGSRLLRIVRLLPEFGGDCVTSPATKSQRSNISTAVLMSNTQSEIEEEIPESSARNTSYRFASSSDHRASEPEHLRPGEIQEITDEGPSRRTTAEMKESPLQGKKVLIVDDQTLPRMLAEKCVARLGAETQTCGNGEEALEVVCKALRNPPNEGPSKFPYDFILMDCQMDVMDGFEATRRIRKEEKKCGIHILIIALTAHEVDGEEGRKIAEAGMDFHLTKPLKPKDLLSLTTSVFN